MFAFLCVRCINVVLQYNALIVCHSFFQAYFGFVLGDSVNFSGFIQYVKETLFSLAL